MQNFTQNSLFEPSHEIIELPQAKLSLDTAFYDENIASQLFKRLMQTIEFSEETISIAGVQRLVPRLTAWYGDSNAEYSYSGVRHSPLPWTPELLQIKKDIEQCTSTSFNSVLCNLYRDGSDSVAWHSDDEIELGDKPVIASLSLGETRRFEMKHKHLSHQNYKLELSSGSLLVMAGQTQSHWQHRISKQENCTNPRINLTFRSIIR